MSYPAIEHIYFEGDHFLGGAIRVTVFLNIDTADTAKITIEDPYDTTKIDAVNMTKENNQVYSYIWQSHEDNDKEGDYSFIIQITSGTNTALLQKFYTMIDPDLGIQ